MVFEKSKVSVCRVVRAVEARHAIGWNEQSCSALYEKGQGAIRVDSEVGTNVPHFVTVFRKVSKLKRGLESWTR